MWQACRSTRVGRARRFDSQVDVRRAALSDSLPSTCVLAGLKTSKVCSAARHWPPTKWPKPSPVLVQPGQCRLRRLGRRSPGHRLEDLSDRRQSLSSGQGNARLRRPTATACVPLRRHSPSSWHLNRSGGGTEMMIEIGIAAIRAAPTARVRSQHCRGSRRQLP